MTKKELTTIVEMFKMQGFTLNEVADTVMAVYNTAPQVAEPTPEKPVKAEKSAKIEFVRDKVTTKKGKTCYTVGTVEKLDKPVWNDLFKLVKEHGGIYRADLKVWSFKLKKDADAFVKAVK